MLRSTLLAASLLGFSVLPAFAQEFTAISTIEKVVASEAAEDGSIQVTFVKADRVAPGDDLFYEITFDNATSDAADDVKLVMDVPAEVTYRENSASVAGEDGISRSLADAGVSVMFSTDNGKSFSPRGSLTVSAAGQNREAVSEDITNIRFAFLEPISAGTNGSVSFSAVVR